MKRPIDLEAAARAEVTGALAGRRHGKSSQAGERAAGRTPAQSRAFEELLSSLLEFANASGARRKTVKLGKVSIKLRSHGAEEILSVRRLAAA